MKKKKIHLKIEVASIDENMREYHLIWFGYVQRKVTNSPVRTSELVQVEEKENSRGIQKITLVEVVKNDIY